MKKIGFFILMFVMCIVILYAQEALRLSENGNVGIGIPTPNEKLEVDGNVKSNGRILDKSGEVMPVGTILSYAGVNVPAGWLLCDGASLLRSEYSDLFAVLDVTYGPGDGADTFNVPDLRGVFLRGWNPESSGQNNDNLQSDGSTYRGFGELQDDAVQEITGTVTWDNVHEAGGDSADPDTYPEIAAGTVQASTINKSVSLTGYRNADETRPRNIAINYIIKY